MAPVLVTRRYPQRSASRSSIDSMDSGFTLTRLIGLAFTVLASNPQETMVPVGDWQGQGGFVASLSWMRVDGCVGRQLGTNALDARNEIHVGSVGGLRPP